MNDRAPLGYKERLGGMGPVVEQQTLNGPRCEGINTSILSVEDEPFQKAERLKLDPALSMEEKDLEQIGAG